MGSERSYVGWGVGIAAIVAAAALGFYFWQQRTIGTPPPAPQVQTAPAPKVEPQIQHPVQVTEAEPLPPLEQSDALLKETLVQKFGRKRVSEFFFLDGIVRRIVATIDNLPREKVATKVMAVKPVAGSFAVAGKGEELVIAPGNGSRYGGYVELAQSIDVKQAVALYLRLYPLFQQAYQDLGYPKGYFNDRLVEVIDHLLVAPEVSAPIKLVQPKVRYEFADPALESLSAGQKIMVRIGADNAARIKAILREVRRELIGQPSQK